MAAILFKKLCKCPEIYAMNVLYDIIHHLVPVHDGTTKKK